MFDSMLLEMENLFKEIYPMSKELVGAATIMAGAATILYIAIRLWVTWGRGQEIDFVAYLRPFAITMAITFFPAIISITEAFLSPVTAGTEMIVERTAKDVASLEKQRTVELEKFKNRMTEEEKAKYLAIDNSDSSEYDKVIAKTNAWVSSLFNMDAARAQLSGWLQIGLIWILEQLHLIVKFAIGVISVFFRIVLSVIGPFVFAISLLPGFEGNIPSWFARYINVYLYIPIANIFSALLSRISSIQLTNTIVMLKNGTYENTSSDASYIIFVAVGIIGYLSIPTIATWVVQSSGGGNYTSKVNQSTAKGAGSAGNAASAVARNASPSVAKIAGTVAGKILK